jgi:hypothetical protein
MLGSEHASPGLTDDLIAAGDIESLKEIVELV